VEALDDFLHGRITQLLLNLERSQRQIVELTGSGPIIVRGVAGSGKTALAMHRIHHVMRQAARLAEPHVLFVTYSRALTDVARQLLTALGVPASSGLEVTSLHKWCLDFAKGHGHPLRGEERERLVEEAVKEARPKQRESVVWDYPTPFWVDELHRIKSGLEGGRDEYSTMRRHGAGRGLDRRLRTLVWHVYEAYERLRGGRPDWDDVVRRAYLRARELGDQAPRFDHVVVDEAQDLTVLGLRLVAHLGRAPGQLFVAFDPAQSIFERGFRWKDAGIRAHGSRSFDLRANYRNTYEVLEAARPLLTGIYPGSTEDSPEDGDEVLQPELARRHGKPPRLLVTPRSGECSVIAVEIRQRIERDRLPPENIAVLCYPNYTRDRMFAELTRAGIPCQKRDDESEIRVSDPSVKVLSLKSAKGLEFPLVYFIASGRWFKPPSGFRDAAEQAVWFAEVRRLFYMAMTRAMSELVIVHAQGDPAPALLEVRWSSTTPGASEGGVAPPAVVAVAAAGRDEPKPLSTKSALPSLAYQQGPFFHRVGCAQLRRGQGWRAFSTPEEARAEGLRACPLCIER
jgi:superfamily I DNA/RNA helicase